MKATRVGASFNFTSEHANPGTLSRPLAFRAVATAVACASSDEPYLLRGALAKSSPNYASFACLLLRTGGVHAGRLGLPEVDSRDWNRWHKARAVNSSAGAPPQSQAELVHTPGDSLRLNDTAV